MTRREFFRRCAGAAVAVAGGVAVAGAVDAQEPVLLPMMQDHPPAAPMVAEMTVTGSSAGCTYEYTLIMLDANGHEVRFGEE